MYPEDQEEQILAIFSSMEKADAYVKNWNENYRKECEEFATRNNYQQYEDYEFKHIFTEEVCVIVYELQ